MKYPFKKMHIQVSTIGFVCVCFLGNGSCNCARTSACVRWQWERWEKDISSTSYVISARASAVLLIAVWHNTYTATQLDQKTHAHTRVHTNSIPDLHKNCSFFHKQIKKQTFLNTVFGSPHKIYKNDNASVFYCWHMRHCITVDIFQSHLLSQRFLFTFFCLLNIYSKCKWLSDALVWLPWSKAQL